MPIVTTEPVYAINAYLFSHPHITALLGNTNAEDAPVYTFSEEPESVVPFVVFNYKMSNDSTMWWVQMDDITYTIFDTNFARMDKIVRAINDVLGRLDESGREVNSWLKANSPAEFRFHYTKLMSNLPVDPFDQEGGAVMRTVLFRVGYTPRVGTGIV